MSRPSSLLQIVKVGSYKNNKSCLRVTLPIVVAKRLSVSYGDSVGFRSVGEEIYLGRANVGSPRSRISSLSLSSSSYRITLPKRVASKLSVHHGEYVGFFESESGVMISKIGKDQRLGRASVKRNSDQVF